MLKGDLEGEDSITTFDFTSAASFIFFLSNGYGSHFFLYTNYNKLLVVLCATSGIYLKIFPVLKCTGNLYL